MEFKKLEGREVGIDDYRHKFSADGLKIRKPLLYISAEREHFLLCCFETNLCRIMKIIGRIGR